MFRMLMPYLPEQYQDELLERWLRDRPPEPAPAERFAGAWSVRSSRLVLTWGALRQSRYALTQEQFLAVTSHLMKDDP